MAAKTVDCKVKSLKMLTPTVFELLFDPSPEFEFEAGQFVSVIVPGAGPGGRDLRRAYSIASGPQVRPVELCVKLVEGGPGTNYLHSLREGTSFRGMAPYGDFVYEPKEGRHALFIATGTGIAPFRSFVHSKEYREAPPLSTTCLLGVRHEEELLYMDEMSRVAGLKWVPVVSQPKGAWRGFKGRVTDYLREHAGEIDWGRTEFYLCGNGAMISEIKTILAEKGVAKESLHQEKYY
jgi:NAD(P)H-flavin reductase